MTDRIKRVKVKCADGGTESAYLPIGADAINVDMADGRNVEDTINSLNFKMKMGYQTIADMIEDKSISIGEVINVLNYQKSGDNGAATFEISANKNNKVWNVKLNNGLYANLKQDNSVVKYIFPNNWRTDVDQGDANLIIAFGKVILIDSHRTSVWNQLKEYLSYYNISHIDYYINTHYHDDHAGNNVNLIENGYVDQDTKIYLPAYSKLIESAAQMRNYYNATMNALAAHNLNSIEMKDGITKIELGYSFKLTFYNCETNIYDVEKKYTDYNDCSLICFVEHNGVKSLYTGDCGNLTRLVDVNRKTEHIHFYKIAHHGINEELDNEEVYYLRYAMPNYAVQPSSSLSAEKEIYTRGVSMAWLMDNGCHVYSVHEQEEYIEFESRNNQFIPIKGKENAKCGVGLAVETIYVDENYTTGDSIGTKNRPFRTLGQALGYCGSRGANGVTTIQLGQGENLTTSGKAHKVRSRHKKVIILGASADDPSLTKLKCYFNAIQDAEVEFKNITFIGMNTSSILSLGANSHVYCENCKFEMDSSLAETTITSFIWQGGVHNSTLILKNCIFEGPNVTMAISSHTGGTVESYSCTYNVKQNAIYMRENGTVKAIGNTYGNMTGKPIVLDSNSYMYPGFDLILAREVKENNIDIDLNTKFGNYWMFMVQSGVVGANTYVTDFITGFTTTGFTSGHTQFVRTFDNRIKINFKDDGHTINISYENPDKIVNNQLRYIYGIPYMPFTKNSQILNQEP